MKTESIIDAMADGEGKITAQKEIALAQAAMLDGKMGACGMHLSKAMHASTSKQACRTVGLPQGPIASRSAL